MTNFSDELKNEAQKYLKKKTDLKPSKEIVNEFLTDMARLGELFQKNLKEILKLEK